MSGHPASSEPRPSQLRQVPRDAREFQGRPAGVVSRALAAVFDGLVVVVVVVGLWLGWAALTFLFQPARFSFPSPPPLGASGVCAVLAFLYLTAAWATSGRTPGNRLLGLRVMRADGRPLGWAASALRAVLCVLFPIGLAWAAVSRRSRSVQDVVVRTCVVYDWRQHESLAPGQE